MMVASSRGLSDRLLQRAKASERRAAAAELTLHQIAGLVKPGAVSAEEVLAQIRALLVKPDTADPFWPDYSDEGSF